MDELRYRWIHPAEPFGFSRPGFQFIVAGPPRIVDEDFTSAFLLVHRWCHEQFGPPTGYGDASATWDFTTLGDLWIGDPDHALAFRVRWC